MTDDQKKKGRVPKAIRVNDEEWKTWGEIAGKLGLTRSAFIKQATANAAQLVLAGGLPYFVEAAQPTTQNTRISFFGDEVTEKGNAGDRRQRRGVSQGSDDEGGKKRKPKG